VCGRRELFSLLKYRAKYHKILEKERRHVKQSQDKAIKELKLQNVTEEDMEAENDK